MRKGSSKIDTTNKKTQPDINDLVYIKNYSRSEMMPTYPMVLEQQGPPSNPEADTSIRPYLPKNKLPPPDLPELHAT